MGNSYSSASKLVDVKVQDAADCYIFNGIVESLQLYQQHYLENSKFSEQCFEFLNTTINTLTILHDAVKEFSQN